MRVAVVGATGNAGTAVLEALVSTREVTSVVGIARRLPDRLAFPYSECSWESIDIGSSDATRELSAAFAGADAVIHLAWLIQPNTRRDLLRRVNVDGTARVADAAAAAGVRHLVVASSVGAYAPDAGHGLRDEAWPTGGISSSHYSVDKAAQERALDAFSRAHPQTVVTRLRPALIFGARPASEIQRYFLATWLPVGWLRTSRLPVVPLPSGLRGLQAVHVDDLGRAYAAAVLHPTPGAFNICADDVLTPDVLAATLDHGRSVRVPDAAVRAALAVSHDVGLVAADAGWLDMGLQVPLMDNGRARALLGWRPQRTAEEALRTLVGGMAEGTGGASSPLRPRHADREEPATPAPDWGAGLDRRLLAIYLQDHLAGGDAGLARIDRMAAEYVDTPAYATLSWVAEETRDDHAFLTDLLAVLGIGRPRLKGALTRLAERGGRLKPNGAARSRSPLTLLVEVDAMRSAVTGKLGVWQTLEANAGALGLDPAPFTRRADGARAQAAALQDVHEYARGTAFHRDGMGI